MMNSDMELLHDVINNAHHSKKVDQKYIYRKMHNDYRIPIDRVESVFNESLANGTLKRDGNGGYYSTEDPTFDYDDASSSNQKPNLKKSVRSTTEFLYWIAGIVLAIIGLWQFFKR